MAARDDQFRVLLRMQIKPGMERQFEQEWRSVGGVVTADDANLGQWLARSAEEESVYYIVSDWVNEARFREFERSAAHVRHRERLHPFRCGGSMVTMHVVTHMAGPAGGDA